MNRTIPAIALCAALAACAGRSPAPVAVSQVGDAQRDCHAISAEIVSNNQKLGELGGQKGMKVAQNTAAIVVGLFVWPVLFATDFQGAAATEAEALQKRTEHLATLAREKGC